MTIRARNFPWLVVAALVLIEGRARAQDAPLYRDPSPTEGARIEGPLLPARPRTVPPPPGTLGPFQPSANSSNSLPEGFEPPHDPVLGIPPIAPPLPALPMPALAPPLIREDGGVEMRRTTKIRGPNGVLGRFHEWFRDAVFGTPKAPSPMTAPRRGFFGLSSTSVSSGEAPPRLFHWPEWPSWPLSPGH